MRFSNILLAYFVMGAVMWGGGVLAWDEAGVGQFFIEDPGQNTSINEQTSSQLGNLGGPIQAAAGSFAGGGLIAIWNILVQLIGYLFWPIVALLSVNAPPRVVVLIGGTPVVAFFGTLLRLVRQSA